MLPEGDGTAFGSFDGPLYADDLAEVGGFKVSLRSVPEHDVAYGTIVLKNHGARDLEIIQVKPRESTNLSASYFGWRKWHPVS
ncbi:MAG: hypothetical protein LBG70_00820, partial [Bifidobacteriaceae bacterium]|nr:hypothetical protein [Bifidobacteriaceae bacterium]